jgi:hypothetical protein
MKQEREIEEDRKCHLSGLPFPEYVNKYPGTNQ